MLAKQVQERKERVDKRSKEIRLGVVIVTYNRRKLLEECINACLKQTTPFSQIIVVDNASTDSTKEYLKSVPQVNAISLDKNIGGAGGFYEGIKVAIEANTLDYVLLIDDDAILDLNYNTTILPYMRKDPSNAYSGTVITKGLIQYIHRRFLERDFEQRNSTPLDYEKEQFKYDLSTFCGIFIPTSLIRKIGLPRKDFFIWFDDTEYSIRIRKHAGIININNAFLNHKTSNTSSNNSYNWKEYYGVRNQYLIIKEYFPKTLPKYVGKIRIKMIVWKILSLLKPKQRLYYQSRIRLHKDAINDAKANKLGVNPKYTPTKAKERS